MHGGLHLLAHKAISIGKPITTLPVPKTIQIHIRTADEVLLHVAAGQSVLLGESLAQVQGRKSHHVLASVSGIVSKVEPLAEKNATIIHIDNDFFDTSHNSWTPVENFAVFSRAELCQLIERAGIVGLGGAGFPTAKKLGTALNREQLTLVINGAECEPFITCDDALMREHADDILLGVRVLARCCNAARIIIAVESDKPAAYQALKAALLANERFDITICSVDAIYPKGDERLLITALTGKEVPSGGIPADINVLCHNVGTAAAVGQLIRLGKPLIDRVVTLTGSGIREPHNFRVRLGTPIAHLIAETGGYAGNVEQLIVGGSMMGVAQSDDGGVIEATTNCLIAATSSDFPPRRAEMPCIRCGDCSHVCPANLLPQQLLRYAQANNHRALQALGLQDCIECGCCDYVCPSHIRLVSRFIDAKLADTSIYSMHSPRR